MIRQSFTRAKKYFIWGFVVAMITTFLYVIVGIGLESYRYNEICEAQSVYGEYHYRIDYLQDDQIENIKQLKNVEKILPLCYLEDSYKGDFNESPLLVCRTSEDFFSFSDYHIIEGRFPQSDDEILVSKWYMIQLGVNSGEMLDSTVQVMNPETMKMEAKMVVGLINQARKENCVDIEKSPMIVFDADSVKWRKEKTVWYIQMKDGTIPDELLEGGSYSYNTNLMFFEGLSAGGRKYLSKYYALFWGGLVLCFFWMSVLVTSIYQITMQKVSTEMSIFWMLGADMCEIKHIFNRMFLKWYLFGEAMGALLAITAGHMIMKSLDFKMKIPAVLLIAGMILEIIFVMLVLAKKYKQEKKRLIGYRSIFKNRFGNILKYGFRNFQVYHARKKISMAVIAAGIMIVSIVAFVLFQKQMQQPDNNDSLRYYVEIDDIFYMDIYTSPQERESMQTTLERLSDYCKSNYIAQYYIDSVTQDYAVKKKNMDQELVDSISKTAKGAAKISNPNSVYKTRVTIMGCSEVELEQLGFPKDYLNDGTGILLSRFTGKNAPTGHLTSMEGEYINVTSLMGEESDGQLIDVEIPIKATVDKLPAYPILDEPALCILLNSDIYQKYFNDGYISSFYLKDAHDDDLLMIQNIISGNPHIKWIDQKKEAESYEKMKNNMMILLLLFLLMTVIFCYCHIQLQNMYEYDSRKEEFELLKRMGIESKQLDWIYGLESSLVFVFGWGGGVLGCLLIRYCLKYFHYDCSLMPTVVGISFIYMVVASVTTLFFSMRYMNKRTG
ncbi:MAG: hypothetical protein K6G13_09950 [Agathobacter sp.]|uniref:FtsX-like permease family protein n=1 Tax=Agathobacter sp. TaxID=2021311 RepID=UPI0025834510|nr:FtsX-like permease family protein [Agathobacter sp.]MCR5678338.1 hypothetical protein [Agathobacter sp.]